MQNIIFYVAANETLGVVKDYANARTVTPPTLVRGVEVCLKMRLFAGRDGMEAYPLPLLERIVSWQWAMDNDFNASTVYKLIGDNADISTAEISEQIEGEEVVYTEISIPVSNMNTEEVAAWLGTEKSKSGLIGELIGFDADGRQVFILQIENFTVRNRITSLAAPVPIEPDYLTSAQVSAMIAAGVMLQFSVDRTDWHDVQADTDRHLRFRSAAASGAIWSEPLKMSAGVKGDPGRDSFCYVAYASNATGTGFSFAPANNLKYRAEIHVPEAIAEPSAEDFSGATWVKYIGDDGQGVGDMLRSIYDTDEDGKVDSAEEADHATAADAVPWSGVTGKPSTYAPAAHIHAMSDISNPVFQKVYAASNPKTLFLDSPVIRNTSINSSGTIELDFTAVMDKVGGSAYSAVDGVMLTWEYHATCSTIITGVSVGSVNCSMVGINIPETLELVNNAVTVHVFVIRAVYKSGAVNNLRFQANYAYSYEA